MTKLKLPYFLVHHEKAGFFGKDRSAGKNRRQQGKRKTKFGMVWLRKETTGTSPEDPSRTAHHGHHSLTGSPGVTAGSTVHNTH